MEWTFVSMVVLALLHTTAAQNDLVVAMGTALYDNDGQQFLDRWLRQSM